MVPQLIYYEIKNLSGAQLRETEKDSCFRTDRADIFGRVFLAEGFSSESASEEKETTEHLMVPLARD